MSETELTILITRGDGWYSRLVGHKCRVTKGSGDYFNGVVSPTMKINKNHAVVTAVDYGDETMNDDGAVGGGRMPEHDGVVGG